MYFNHNYFKYQNREELKYLNHEMNWFFSYFSYLYKAETEEDELVLFTSVWN